MKYDAICLTCAHTYEYFRSVADRAMIPVCPECGSGEVRKVILSVQKGFVKGNFAPFKSNLDGSIITCSRDLEEHNKRNNVTLLGDGYSNEDILAGKCCEKAPQEDKKAVAADIVDSIRRVEAGYKPTIESEGAEL
jgi:putative FmdB family regulatory protein